MLQSTPGIQKIARGRNIIKKKKRKTIKIKTAAQNLQSEQQDGDVEEVEEIDQDEINKFLASFERKTSIWANSREKAALIIQKCWRRYYVLFE